MACLDGAGVLHWNPFWSLWPYWLVCCLLPSKARRQEAGLLSVPLPPRYGILFRELASLLPESQSTLLEFYLLSCCLLSFPARPCGEWRLHADERRISQLLKRISFWLSYKLETEERFWSKLCVLRGLSRNLDFGNHSDTIIWLNWISERILWPLFWMFQLLKKHSPHLTRICSVMANHSSYWQNRNRERLPDVHSTGKRAHPRAFRPFLPARGRFLQTLWFLFLGGGGHQ